MQDGLNLQMLYQWIKTMKQRSDLLRAPDCPLSRRDRLRALTHAAEDLQMLAEACEHAAHAATKAALTIEFGD